VHERQRKACGELAEARIDAKALLPALTASPNRLEVRLDSESSVPCSL